MCFAALQEWFRVRWCCCQKLGLGFRDAKLRDALGRVKWHLTRKATLPLALLVPRIRHPQPRLKRLTIRASHFKSKHNTTIMSRSTDPGHFFQSDASEAIRARRAAKSGNTFGDPIKLQSKILAVVADPASSASIYVAESAGCIRRVNLDVSYFSNCLHTQI